MRVAHISDLHFGRRVCPERLRSFGEDLVAQAPRLMVITGDITDRGRVSQFRWARGFLDSLGIPFISVPGNREIGISAFWEWVAPRLAMKRYSRFFGEKDRLLYLCEEDRVAFLGLNSVHPFPSWPGTVSRESRYWLKEQAAALTGYHKVLFLHHPVMPVIRGSSYWAHSLSDAGEVLNICSSLGISLILQGHKHRSSVVEVRVPERSARVIVSAGGAPLMSRWDAAYHLIDILGSEIVVTPRSFLEGAFRENGSYRFPMRGSETAAFDTTQRRSASLLD